MAIMSEERPVLSRLDLLDNMLRQLEEMRGCNQSSWASTPTCGSGGTFTSHEGEVEGHDNCKYPSSIESSSPRASCLEKHCRSIHHVMLEAQVKGTLVERLDQVEDRLLKLCLQLGEEIEAEKRMKSEDHHHHHHYQNSHINNNGDKKKKKTNKKGITQFVKQIVKGKHSKHHTNQASS